MRRFKQDKLWRSSLVDRMKNQGSIVHTKELSSREFDDELRKKLVEEVQEVCLAETTPQIMEEIADVYEVIDQLTQHHKINVEQIKRIQTEKREDRGSFTPDSFVAYTDHPKGSFGEKYCLSDPKKYPEI